ncbi:MAG: D-alanyl-D-alanine carboxypeptidase/D-alanyl-D-alanine-endopeptidase [Nocardioidaceae bacterium]|nr:D-alanyl-D-alanine carboxypeptidase/D-alanyl-D-alanine-endopeptidase [Nocardioidaceae bacterium]MCL2614099.1 D-alanyl-D-alanine carboxypeptidase/D-alanyl-D-alanine-endopeptidase [Nocardioidaceae bacterium]
MAGSTDTKTRGSKDAGRAGGSSVRRRVLIVVPLVLVLALAGAGGVGWRTGRLTEWWHDLRGGGAASGPAAVAAPKGVDAPGVVRPAVVATAVDGALRPRAAKVRAAIWADLHKHVLGKHVLALVAPLTGSGTTFRYDSSGRFLATPASTTKLVTTSSTLFALGAQHTFKTRTVLSGSGSSHRLTLIGGGDPYLASTPGQDAPGPTYDLHRADVTTLGIRAAAALKRQGVHRVRLGYDESLFTGPSVNPRWEPDYVPSGEVSPTTSLWVDEGHSTFHGRLYADPAVTAALYLAQALTQHGIHVLGAPTRTVAPAGAHPLVSVSSAPLGEIVQRILQVSDNDGAEVLLRQLGIAEEGRGSFAAGRRAVRQVLAANDIPMQGSVLYDGSGLSRDDLMSPGLLVDVLRFDARRDQPNQRAVLLGLPVAGFNGSLIESSGGPTPQGWGRVRGKTGTLTGVSALAGIAVGRDGVPMVFALMTDHIPPGKDGLARIARDDTASALGACRCG